MHGLLACLHRWLLDIELLLEMWMMFCSYYMDQWDWTRDLENFGYDALRNGL